MASVQAPDGNSPLKSGSCIRLGRNLHINTRSTDGVHLVLETSVLKVASLSSLRFCFFRKAFEHPVFGHSWKDPQRQLLTAPHVWESRVSRKVCNYVFLDLRCRESSTRKLPRTQTQAVWPTVVFEGFFRYWAKGIQVQVDVLRRFFEILRVDLC